MNPHVLSGGRLTCLGLTYYSNTFSPLMLTTNGRRDGSHSRVSPAEASAECPFSKCAHLNRQDSSLCRAGGSVRLRGGWRTSGLGGGGDCRGARPQLTAGASPQRLNSCFPATRRDGGNRVIPRAWGQEGVFDRVKDPVQNSMKTSKITCLILFKNLDFRRSLRMEVNNKL